MVGVESAIVPNVEAPCTLVSNGCSGPVSTETTKQQPHHLTLSLTYHLIMSSTPHLAVSLYPSLLQSVLSVHVLVPAPSSNPAPPYHLSLCHFIFCPILSSAHLSIVCLFVHLIHPCPSSSSVSAPQYSLAGTREDNREEGEFGLCSV